MIVRFRRHFLLAIVCWLFVGPSDAAAETTVSDVDKYSYGANLGWIDWQGDGTSGAAFSAAFASGFIYGANIGWISIGDGSPLNGTDYGNASAADFGVNVDADSDPDFFLLSGRAYSANIGWINFDVVAQTGPTGRPRIDKTDARLKGFAYSANLGWLSLESDGIAIVRTGLLSAVADAWMLYR